jgi:hypothetical protein
MMEISAWNSMKRARDLLTVAGCFAAKGVDDDDSCRDLAEKFATLIDLIENEALFTWIKKHPSTTGRLYAIDEAQNFAPSQKMTPCKGRR